MRRGGPLFLAAAWALVACGDGRPPQAGPPPLVVELAGGATMEFVRIEAGPFQMGSPLSEPARDEDEGPRHEVAIGRPFYLGKTEVTQGQWEAVMGTRPWAGEDFVHGGADYPAVNLSWDDARALAEALNRLSGGARYRLPTEAEWEYACRAGTVTPWSFGDDPGRLDEYAWHTGNAWDAGERYAHAVAAKAPNPWGLYDMHGNVNEWVQDGYDPTYYARSPAVDPAGPEQAEMRVYRGGYFHSGGARRLRCANRMFFQPEARAASVGARLVREVDASAGASPP